MKNTTEITNKEFAEKYINLHYDVLCAKFRAICCKINDKGVSSIDILNDTCISLYWLKECYSYQEFERLADKKFKICADEMKKGTIKADEDEDEND